MADIPTGTVTFMFTDIEGSTNLVKRLRERYPETLAEQREILRHAFAEHGGVEVDSQGDAFFVAFPRARQAGLAAVAAQRALAAHAWPDGAEVRVRMALHTGEAEVRDGRYHGLAVHRGARILAAGHGGQILVSQATAAVLADEDLPGISLRSLGRFRLKDLDAPEHVHQLVAEGLRGDLPAPKAERTRAVPTRAVLGAASAAGLVAALVVAILALTGTGDEGPDGVPGNAVGSIHADSGRLTSAVEVGRGPSRVAVGDDAVWVANETSGTVSRIDPRHDVVVQTTRVGSAPSGVAVTDDAVWVTNGVDGTVSRISADTNEVVQVIRVGSAPRDVAAGEGGVWVANRNDRTLSRIHPRTGEVVATIPLTAAPLRVATGAGSVWVTQEDSTVVRLDAATNSVVRTIGVGGGPDGIAFGGDAVWVANTLDRTISQIDPDTSSVTATIPVEGNPEAVVATPAGVWVALDNPGRAALVDPEARAVVRTVELGNRPVALAHGSDAVWVAVRAGDASAHVGGTLRGLLPHELDSIDPAFAYTGGSWHLLSLTSDGLVGYRRVGGVRGTELVPDLAVAIPAPTNGGRVYAFQLRPGIRYSNGARVRAGDVRRSLERVFESGSPGGPAFYGRIVGASACGPEPGRCDLSKGIVVNERTRTVTFRLTEPDPEFLYKLAVPTAYLVPPGTPKGDVGPRPIPGTGPYAIAQYVPDRILRLERNPHFREWSKDSQPAGFPDEISWRIGVPHEKTVGEVEAGRADYVLGPPPAAQIEKIVTQYPTRAHAAPVEGTIYLGLNTRVPPFDKLDVRRALNFAVDRGALVELAGGAGSGRPTCQILPPAFPGYERYCPYTRNPSPDGEWTAPDLARAKALVRRSGTQGSRVTVWEIAPGATEAPELVRLLKRLGYRADLKRVDRDRFVGAAFDPAGTVQAALFWWFADYPAASNFLVPQFTCGAESNLTKLCDPKLDALMRRALRLQATDPQGANRLWAQVDRMVVDRAPWVALFTPVNLDFVSERLGNYQSHPVFGLLASQAWVR